MSVSRRNAQLSTSLSGSSLRAAFVKCWQTALCRENKRRSTISHPRFNYLIESDGTPVEAIRPPVVLRTFSLARFPHNDSTLQMHVTFDKSFRIFGEVSRSVSLFLIPLPTWRRPITVKDPHLLCSRLGTSERADQRRQSSPSGFADAGVRGSAITTRASLHACVATGAIHLSMLILIPVSRQSRECHIAIG